MNLNVADGGYAAWLRRAMRPFPGEAALRTAVGGDYEAMGKVQRAILEHAGLRPGASVIDVGCGVGRLAHEIAKIAPGRYLGTDVIPAFLRSARRNVRAENVRFARVRGLTIPAPDRSADMVCFFSVFTHLLHEHTYLYLEEARRVLVPGGRIVFSFLELASPAQWSAFADTVRHARERRPRTLNVFVERPAIATWAERLALEVIELHDGDEPFAPLAEPVVFESGAVQERLGHLGQSIAILAKRPG